ncbi:acyltransferase, partial [Klebsiella pneumoniae]|nr:acyltransferase [Klebsiella pneumoniae]
ASTIFGVHYPLRNIRICQTVLRRRLHTRPFYDMLSGRLTRIVVRINLVPIGEELHGDYVNDKNFKRSFQRWLNGLWEEKDRQLTDIMRDKER